MPRDYCRNCGDILSTDPEGGNCMPGDEYCDMCCVMLREEHDAALDADNNDHDEDAAEPVAGAAQS